MVGFIIAPALVPWPRFTLSPPDTVSIEAFQPLLCSSLGCSIPEQTIRQSQHQEKIWRCIIHGIAEQRRDQICSDDGKYTDRQVVETAPATQEIAKMKGQADDVEQHGWDTLAGGQLDEFIVRAVDFKGAILMIKKSQILRTMAEPWFHQGETQSVLPQSPAA